MPELADHLPQFGRPDDLGSGPEPTTPDAVTALLVDADRSFVQFAREELNQTSGPPVCLLHAASLEQADAILSESPVAVVLLDRWLPDGDGLEWLKTHRARLSAGVLVLTHSSDPQEPSPVSLGAQDLIVKPHVDGDHLARAIRYAAERERTRQRLLQSRAQFQSLIEHSSDLITVVERTGSVVYQSPSAALLLGTPPHAHHGATFPELVHPEDAARARRLIEEVFSGNSTPRGEFRLPHADGSMRAFDVIGSRMMLDGGVVRAVLNARDITERCQAEEALRLREAELRQAQKMEAVGRLAGGIAHDFSNVLTVIAGACERIREDIANGCAEPGQVEVVLRHCARATGLTRQLLAFSRQQVIAPSVIDVDALLAQSRELISQLIGDNISLQLDVEPDVPAVAGDPVQMEQVLMNLVINARDAMPEGGQMSISLARVMVTVEQAVARPPLRAGEYLRLAVADTGHGMTPEVQARAFEPFFTTKDPTRGTGLGLATVYGIVTQSGGHISIDSAPGRGTRFEILLPVERGVAGATPGNGTAPTVGAATEPVREASPSSEVWGRLSPTILVTEDDPDLRALLCEALAASGYRVVGASSPDEAARVLSLHRGPIDLLLTDLVMPGGSGHELARRVIGAYPQVKVLYMSGYGETSANDSETLEPGDRLLSKPFTRQQLLDIVATVLD